MKPRTIADTVVGTVLLLIGFYVSAQADDVAEHPSPLQVGDIMGNPSPPVPKLADFFAVCDTIADGANKSQCILKQLRQHQQAVDEAYPPELRPPDGCLRVRYYVKRRQSEDPEKWNRIERRDPFTLPCAELEARFPSLARPPCVSVECRIEELETRIRELEANQ